MGYARTQRRSRWTVNGRATLGIGQHRRCGCWQWVPVVRASSARSGVCWHRQLHRFHSLLIQRGIDRGSHPRTRLACSTCEGTGNQCRATSSLHQAQPRTQLIGHWSRGAARTTYRHSFAFHASLPVNRGYDQCAQAYQQAKRGEWAEAEKSLLEGSRRLPPLSQWVPNFVTQVEQRRGDVSGLLLATEADRDGMVGLVLLSLQSVGCHAGKT